LTVVKSDFIAVKDSSAKDILLAHDNNGGGGGGEANDCYDAKIDGSVNKAPVC